MATEGQIIASASHPIKAVIVPDATSSSSGGITPSQFTRLNAAGLGFYGDGSDGNVTLDGVVVPPWATLNGSTYTLTRCVYADTLIVQNGIQLNTVDFIIFCKTKFWDQTGSVIDCSGSDGTMGPPASGGPGVAPAALNSTAGTGGNGVTGAPGPIDNPPAVTNAVGGSGGAGGAGGSGAGGVPGVASAPSASQGKPRALPYSVYGSSFVSNGGTTFFGGGSGGGQGAGDGVNTSGPGGGGGGVMSIAALALQNDGILQAKGGKGATPTVGNCGGGGGGGGGVIQLTYGSKTGSGTTSVAGGAPGNGHGTGVAGVAGSAGVVIEVVN